MEMVKVYFFMGYDIANDRVLESKRPATLETIKRYGGTPIMNKVLDVGADRLDGYGFYLDQVVSPPWTRSS